MFQAAKADAAAAAGKAAAILTAVAGGWRAAAELPRNHVTAAKDWKRTAAATARKPPLLEWRPPAAASEQPA